MNHQHTLPVLACFESVTMVQTEYYGNLKQGQVCFGLVSQSLFSCVEELGKKCFLTITISIWTLKKG